MTYGMLLFDDKPHPDPEALKAMSFSANKFDSEINPNATDGDSVADEHLQVMSLTMSNLRRMGLVADAEGKDAWMKEVRLLSTAARAVCIYVFVKAAVIQWNNVTVGGVMRFIFSWLGGSLDENLMKEVATRLPGFALITTLTHDFPTLTMIQERRPLNDKEASYLLTPQEFTNFTLALTVTLDPFASFPVFLSALNESLENVVNLNPTLGCRIISLPVPNDSPKPVHKLYFEKQSSPIPVRVEPLASFNTVLEQETSTSVAVAIGPLLRVVVLEPEKGTSTVKVLFTFAHVAIDGRGGVEVLKDWVQEMRSRMTNGHHRSAVATKLKQNLSDGFISDLVPLSSRESWLSYFYFTSHSLAISMWMWLNKPPVIKMLRDVKAGFAKVGGIPGTRLVRLKLTHRQTAAAIARAKELGVSMTALLTSSGAVALAPFTALESHHRSMFRVGFNWRKWLRLPFSWLFTKSTSTISAIHPKHVPLLVGLSVDARPALGLTSYLNGSFNTIMVAAMPRTPLLPPLLSSSKSLFHATAAGAQKLTRDLRQATLPNGIGYAWRYATLLPVNYSHPDSQSLRTWWQPSAKGRALDIHSSNIHLPLCLGISNLGRVEMEDAKSAIGKDDTWVKEIWLVSTVRAVSSWGMLQWNTITLDGIMYVVIASAEGCFEKDTVIEISNRFGMALCGEKVEVVSS